jgi:hypothetical protein
MLRDTARSTPEIKTRSRLVKVVGEAKALTADHASWQQFRLANSNSRRAVNFSSAFHNETLSVAGCVNNPDCSRPPQKKKCFPLTGAVH